MTQGSIRAGRLALAGVAAMLASGTAAAERGGPASPAVLGASAADLVYTPVAPCRIIDTRLAGGVLVPGTPRNFFVAGTAFFDLQGGTAGGCGVPSGPATAALVNFVAVQPAGPGNLRAWAFGGAVPNSSVINYAAVAGLNIANGLAIPLCDQAVAACGPGDLTVRADASATHLVADVVGYFRKVESRSFTVDAVLDPAGFHAIAGSGCQQVISVTVNAPVAGRVVVRGTANIALAHVMGTSDSVFTYIGTTAVDCPADSGRARIVTGVGSASPTMTLTVTTNPVRVFDVTPGSYTYFLNLDQTAGTGNDFIAASIEATFHPN
jgi:hypothetical protein